MKTKFFTIKNKLIFSIFIFLILLILNFLLLNLYYKNLKKKIEEINNIKQKIVLSRNIQDQENQYKQLLNSIEQKLGTSSEVVLYNLQQKIERNFENIKNLILNKVKEENWKIISTNFNQNENRLNIVFQIPIKDYQKFSDFIINELLVLKIESLTIEKKDKNYEINLTIKQ